MKILYSYLRKYWKLCLLVILLATINQVFSLFEPIIFQRIIDDYALRYKEIGQAEFLRGTALLLLVFVGNAFVSRIAKNFQDYYLNTVSQRPFESLAYLSLMKRQAPLTQLQKQR